MRRVHGEYPFDRDIWDGIWRYELQHISKAVVDAFLLDVPLVQDDQGELPNKGFRVVRAEYSGEGGKVFAVYKHDDEYHLISAHEDLFVEVLFDRHASIVKPSRHELPVERLPYPSY